MKIKLQILTLAILSIFVISPASAQSFDVPASYGSQPDLSAATFDAVKDFAIESGSQKNQTAKLQKALNEISKMGGGNLIIPAGEYRFAELYMRSNVHVLVSSEATLKPYYTPKTYNIVMIHFTPSRQEVPGEFIENCSISCLDSGKQFCVDYSEIAPDKSEELHRVRFIVNRLVRNFTIADANIIDHYTKFCGIIFVGADTKDVKYKWEVTSPQNGVISNCSITDANHGYGLCQLHAAEGLYFTNIRAKGGVTLRLEGHAGQNVGTKDIYGYKIFNKLGKAAVMYQPHVTHHGLVTIEDVETLGSAFAVLIRAGFIDRLAKSDPNAEVGSFAAGCTIKGIHSVYGRQAQIEAKDVWIYEPSELQYINNNKKDDVFVQTEGASYAVVFDDTRQQYKIECSDISFEGFPATHPSSGVIYREDLPRTQEQTWDIAAGVAAYQ